MSDHSKLKSTESSTVSPGTFGGLVLLALPLIPIFALMGVFQALDTITENDEEQKQLPDPGSEDTNDKME